MATKKLYSRISLCIHRFTLRPMFLPQKIVSMTCISCKLSTSHIVSVKRRHSSKWWAIRHLHDLFKVTVIVFLITKGVMHPVSIMGWCLQPTEDRAKNSAPQIRISYTSLLYAQSDIMPEQVHILWFIFTCCPIFGCCCFFSRFPPLSKLHKIGGFLRRHDSGVCIWLHGMSYKYCCSQ